MPLKLVFCGTPAFAVPTLRQLLADPYFEVAGVVTQPDRPRGRGKKTSGSPVKDAALEAGVAVYQPEKIRSESSVDYFKRVAPGVVVIIAYGQIIPAALIAIPRLGWINLHGSLLPKYRGAAPINWAIVNGEKVTGLTTMQIDSGLDTGPTLLKYQTGISPDETAIDLYNQLAEAGGPLVSETLKKLDRGEITPTPQDNSLATLAPPQITSKPSSSVGRMMPGVPPAATGLSGLPQIRHCDPRNVVNAPGQGCRPRMRL